MQSAAVVGSGHKTVLVTVPNKLGALKELLSTFEKHKFNLTSIRSLPSKTLPESYDFFIDFEAPAESNGGVEALAKDVQAQASTATFLTKDTGKIDGFRPVSTVEVPWFPRTMRDLDGFAEKTLEMGEELDADHPGFHDAEYRKRRADIVRFAKTFRHGQRIPEVQYSETEINTWRTVYTNLKKMYPQYACREHCRILPLLEANAGYSPDRIPQLQEVSDFLESCTGWRLRPVMGLLSPRDFLNGLAFRVFHSTQYIRHHSKPFYTPEPDVCHELLGHVPLFCDPAFADFSEEIGLASLGASDEDIVKLATCYWFTIEFGLCKQDGEIKAYGAGLLSSFGELEYCLTDKPEKRDFNPFETCKVSYPITEYQPVYFVAESFEKAKAQMRQFATTLSRPFSLRYNPYTQSIDVFDSKEKLVKLAEELQSHAALLASAMQKL